MAEVSYEFVEERFPTFRRSDGVNHLLVPVPRCIKCYKPIRPRFAGFSCYNCASNGPVDGIKLRRIVAGTVYIPRVKGYAHTPELLALKASGEHAEAYAEVLQHVLDVERLSDFGLIVPVPPTTPRDPNAGPPALAKALAARVGVPYKKAIAWTRPVRTQKGLDPANRARNVEGGLHASAVVAGRLVLAVDDICTTGSTFREVARAVVAAGGLGVMAAAAGRDYGLEDLVYVGALKKKVE